MKQSIELSGDELNDALGRWMEDGEDFRVGDLKIYVQTREGVWVPYKGGVMLSWEQLPESDGDAS